jgi:hypothetical protein
MRPKDLVVDPRARSLVVSMPLLQLLELSNQLIHNFHLEGFDGRLSTDSVAEDTTL